MPLRQISVSEVMSEDVPVAGPDTPVTELAQEMTKPGHESRDVVVIVDANRRPVGIVTERDLLSRVLAEEVPSGEYLREILLDFDTMLTHIRDRSKSTASVARDLMTSPVTCVEHDTSVAEAAGLMAGRGLRQLPVLREGVVVGLLRRVHIVKAIADLYPTQSEPAEER